jgi:hypothetical protein
MTITPTREGYRKPDGTLITLNAQQVITKLHPHRPTYRRDASLRVAIAKAASSPTWQPTSPAYTAEGATTIRAVMSHKFWQRISVLEAPSHCIDHRDRAACSIDLLARTDKAELLVAAVHSAPFADLNPEALAAELGAAIIMLGDARREIIAHAMVICAHAGTCTLHAIPEHICCLTWIEALSNYHWLQRALTRSDAPPTDSGSPCSHLGSR